MALHWHDADHPVWTAELAAPIRQHHPLDAAATEATGRRVRHLALRDGGRLVGGAQIGLRRWPGWGDFAVLGRGPLWAAELGPSERRAALHALLLRLRREHRGVMAAPDRIGGADPLAGGPWLPVVTPISLAELALDADPETLLARQAGKWRNRLRRAEASGLRVADAPWRPDPAHWLLKAEALQRRTRGYRGAEDAYTLGWAEAGGAGATRLFTARSAGRVVAAMLFLLHPPGASYHIGWSDAAGRAMGAHTLLLWRAALWLSGRGCTALDLDVVETETAPGLARFKLGSGARVVTLGATRLWAPGTGLVRRLADLAPRRAA